MPRRPLLQRWIRESELNTFTGSVSRRLSKSIDMRSVGHLQAYKCDFRALLRCVLSPSDDDCVQSRMLAPTNQESRSKQTSIPDAQHVSACMHIFMAFGERLATKRPFSNLPLSPSQPSKKCGGSLLSGPTKGAADL
ncbi:hypothetical protein CIHG_02869 [Coccidioides immitis H538.4]|uniref:Uncharacterized protein n=3 Tax=Coccidioides immitis TaxID=5501 RepID=A0A0J8R4Q6_COCIT|nr:hypothetical protein CIRG_07582 [Coccidioides immitis RMSCC 2394]KMU79736.1 hypothetical protein CISG_08016 [Coccidioides immitis RMSCC 3703]KMU85087.1 hypothetical protein CIHG_02869 [Coccidioides immitis H538.4]